LEETAVEESYGVPLQPENWDFFRTRHDKARRKLGEVHHFRNGRRHSW